ncbi:hypothetical protein SynA1825c_02186 [Synechococcus sp. A18-25c]|nr:hypothetical protein SynA1560_02226 [Synechococcus sp. A15-60]QNJ20482.1 hypothetical protein SynA1825c_02186 [Synechococcus sp. A18-25c]
MNGFPERFELLFFIGGRGAAALSWQCSAAMSVSNKKAR